MIRCNANRILNTNLSVVNLVSFSWQISDGMVRNKNLATATETCLN